MYYKLLPTCFLLTLVYINKDFDNCNVDLDGQPIFCGGHKGYCFKFTWIY